MQKASLKIYTVNELKNLDAIVHDEKLVAKLNKMIPLMSNPDSLTFTQFVRNLRNGDKTLYKVFLTVKGYILYGHYVNQQFLQAEEYEQCLVIQQFTRWMNYAYLAAIEEFFPYATDKQRGAIERLITRLYGTN